MPQSVRGGKESCCKHVSTTQKWHSKEDEEQTGTDQEDISMSQTQHFQQREVKWNEQGKISRAIWPDQSKNNINLGQNLEREIPRRFG